jgi:hypothetical protein
MSKSSYALVALGAALLNLLVETGPAQASGPVELSDPQLDAVAAGTQRRSLTHLARLVDYRVATSSSGVRLAFGNVVRRAERGGFYSHAFTLYNSEPF